ncbi:MULTISPECIES: phosphoglycerate dehydrogenase [unclassified Thermotoga]|uniref:phosphoglycerate dehydrogenase n=1 Tax=unclassified Thermotoga TaxID=2631113 RepID=UPI000280E822|nr:MULTISPECIES: phosphoglycerate dehydrogenase [unclassified Thermotoga]AIY86165.1 NAD-binding D-isomer specific 2-hydroxyacid dehydrogenase [Thermotoga sp. 2812B]EJX26101.1 NAD-binding D-isomer specific 2-hydroxyacid dehydrogenase [Thermotoga sp. EMP]
MKKVLIVTRTFGKYSQKPVEFLKKEGFEIIRSDTIDPDILKEVDALIVGTHPVTAEMIENSSLKVIAKHGVGVDNIDLEAATKKGIPVTITAGANSLSVAELTIAFIFALSRGLVWAHNKLFLERKWEGTVGQEVSGKTLGVVGFGSIGREVVKKAVCLGMNVLVYDPYVSKDSVRLLEATPVDDLDQLLKESDFISLHVPLNESTKNMIGERELSLMKKSAFLINTSRGGLIDEEALVKALKEGIIAGAALDVFSEEPPNPNSPLFECPNLITTAHIGAHTKEAILRMNMMAAQSVVEFFKGNIPKYVVNKEVVQILKEKGYQEVS